MQSAVHVDAVRMIALFVAAVGRVRSDDGRGRSRGAGDRVRMGVWEKRARGKVSLRSRISKSDFVVHIAVSGVV